MVNPLVSLIITTKNEAAVIQRLLISIKNQTYPNIETLVVDNSSEDETQKIARKYTKRVFTYGPERSAQRNYGAQMSKGEYIVFLDADMELTPNVITSCVSLMTKNKKLSGISIPEESVAQTFWEKVKGFERSFYVEDPSEATDAARFFSKKVFDELGGYDQSITGPEDWDLPERMMKKGYKTNKIKDYIYHYERVPNPFKLAQKKYYYALTAHRYLKKHNLPLFSQKTIYFLRPVFYKQWRILLIHPILTVSMFFMFFVEQFGGGMGFLVGKFRNL
jgi:glycosyltransferase involved in cell wall biosynthesis